MNIKNLLGRFYNIVEGINTQVCRSTGKYLFADITLLGEAYRNCIDEKNYFLKTMQILIPTVPSHTKPDIVKNLVLSLEIAGTINTLKPNTVASPIEMRTFNMVVISENSDMTSWHFDADSAGNSNKYLHPHYHITMGGKLMEEAVEKCTHDFGQTLIMRTPRFTHPPLDIILGIDFVLNHYIDKAYAIYFLENDEYKEITHQVKTYLWKPYALAIAKNFCNNIALDGKNVNFDEDFCKKVIGK